MKLYPFKFSPVKDNYVWGSEEFHIADLGYRKTSILNGFLGTVDLEDLMETYMDRVVGDDIFEYYGRQFPFQLKILSVNGKMPLRVHPGDETASQRYDALGKDKLWYMASAGKGAYLQIGFKHAVDASTLYESCADGSVDALLNRIPVKKGDFVHIPAGVPHAAGGELRIIEISESSPLDFCVCSWGQELGEDEFDPALGLSDAMDFIDYGAWTPVVAQPLGKENVEKLLRLPQFSVNRIKLDNALHIFSEQPGACSAFICTDGEVAVREAGPEKGKAVVIKAGECVLIPSECHDYFLEPRAAGSFLLEATVEPVEKKDSYIDPSVSPTVEE